MCWDGFLSTVQDNTCQLQRYPGLIPISAINIFPAVTLSRQDIIQSSQSIPMLGVPACHKLAMLTVALTGKQRLGTVGTDHTMLISGLLHQHTAAVTAHNLSAQASRCIHKLHTSMYLSTLSKLKFGTTPAQDIPASLSRILVPYGDIY